MKATIILVSYNNGHEILECLKTCLCQIEIEKILVVNNGNSIDTIHEIEKIAATQPRIKLIESGRNIGFGAACNMAAAQSSSDAILFLNPDAILEDGAAGQLLATLDANENSIIGGLVCGENGKEQRGSRRGKLTLISALVSFLGLGKPEKSAGLFRDFNQNREKMPNTDIPVDAISGAFFAIRKSDFDRINGFDEAYFLHIEDIDLCARFIENGGKVIFEPKAIVRHKGGASKASKFFVQWHKFKGFIRYFLKHETLIGKVFSVVLAPIIFAAIMGRLIISNLLSFRQK